jgi:hypothetical protein
MSRIIDKYPQELYTAVLWFRYYERARVTCHLIRDFKNDCYYITFGRIEAIRPAHERIVESYISNYDI